MARSNFSTTLPSIVTLNGKVSLVPDANVATESSSGTQRRKPTGWLPPTSYTFSRDRYDRHEGTYRYQYSLNFNPWNTVTDASGCIGALPGGVFNSRNTLNALYTPQGIPQSWIDQAVQEARLNMKDQDVNLGQAFAERNMTARLLGDTAFSIARAAMDLKKGRWKQASRRLGITNPRQPKGSTFTNKWLELQYGWVPLLSDVHGACDALAKRDKSDWRVTGKGSRKEAIHVSRIPTDVRVSDYGLGKVTGDRGVFVRIDAVPENDLTRSLSALGLTNPAVIAWELVPFSFVADWALPVGDWLSSLDAMLGYGPTTCSISRLERFTATHKLFPSERDVDNYRHRYSRSGTGSRHYVRLNRTVSNSVPLPTLPRFENPLSLGHMANGLALLSQVFR